MKAQVNKALKNSRIGSPVFIKTNIDLLEYRKDVLEHYEKHLKKVGASESEIKKAHAEFFEAYMRFADLVTRATEQGII